MTLGMAMLELNAPADLITEAESEIKVRIAAERAQVAELESEPERLTAGIIRRLTRLSR
jgi:hypothetical protein